MADDQVTEKVSKDADRQKGNKGGKGKKEKRKEPGKVRRWFKDFFSELKKVTWPKFPQVLKQTGTVLLVTVCFLLVMLAFDSLFGYLNQLLTSGLNDESVVSLLTTAVHGGGGLL